MEKEMKKPIKKQEIEKRFFIKRSKVNAISTRESQLSDEIKAFRKVCPKMQPGDSYIYLELETGSNKTI